MVNLGKQIYIFFKLIYFYDEIPPSNDWKIILLLNGSLWEKRQIPLLICLKWKKNNYISILKWMIVFLCDWHLISLLVLQWPTAWSQIPPEKRRADTPSWVRRSHGVSPYHTDLGGPTCTCHQGGAALHGPQDWSASSSISLFPWTKNVMTSIWRNF